MILQKVGDTATGTPDGWTKAARVQKWVCLKVIDQTSNDMVLGTSAYKRGINATLLAFEYKGIGWVVNITPEPQIIKGGYDIDVPQADKIARAARATWELAGMLTGHAAARMPRQAAADPPARLAPRCGHDAAGRRITAEGDQRAARPRDGAVHDGHLHRGSRGTRRGRRDRNPYRAASGQPLSEGHRTPRASNVWRVGHAKSRNTDPSTRRADPTP